MSARARLAGRQEEVLAALLRGDVPPGFVPASAAGTALTTRVLHRKRSDAVHRVAPELGLLPGWRDRFHGWAADHPAAGCAHDDLAAFTAWLPQHHPDAAGWLRLHAVHDGRRRAAVVTIAGRRSLVLGLSTRTWHLTRRRRAGLSEGAAP